MEAHKSPPEEATVESPREERAPEAPKASAKTSDKSRTSKAKNNVRKLRTERMMSKAELARRAGLSALTVDRVERGMPCRMDTKRKILEALELKPSDRVMVFGDAPEDPDVDD
jgi:DNA-binding XRE family transcriptional regulator